ncbi:MAG: hypothetical protein HY321_12845 [Armatimonadetes bacterium]|nr:hypothetical protein [Armatimonadota bacterium]
MPVVVHGRVRSGALELSDPLPMPEGTEVTVSIEAVGVPRRCKAMSDEEFLALPFFGIWADREEMQDSVAWVRKVREAWQERSQPSG